MYKRLSVRRSFVALLIGVLVGGGLLVVTPAGAEVSTAAATNWKKIWKKKIRPQADRRYYTKRKSNRRFSTKGQTAAALANFYTMGQVDAKLGNYYTKAESDMKYAPRPAVIRGTFAMETTAAGAGTIIADNIPFGVTLSEPPVVHYIKVGIAPPAGCSGTVAAPNAQPGHLCVFEALANNGTNQRLFSAVGASNQSSPFGINVAATSLAAGNVFVYGSWAVAPTGL